MKYSRFEELPVWCAASDLYVRVYRMAQLPMFRARGDLSDQLQRAALSVSNNIAEGFELGTTAQTITFLYTAKGSAGEVRSMFRQMEQLDTFSNLKSEISNLISLCEDISRQLAGWLHSLQNTEIKGVRYLTDEVKEQAERKRRVDALLAQLRTLAPLPKNE